MAKQSKTAILLGGQKGILCLPEKQTLKWSKSFKFKVYVNLVPMPVAQDNDIVFTVGMETAQKGLFLSWFRLKGPVHFTEEIQICFNSEAVFQLQ